MTSSDFRDLVDTLKDHELSIDDGELIVELRDSLISKQELEKIVKGVGYLYDDIRTIRKDKLYLSLDAGNWSSDCPLYNNWKTLFSFVEGTSQFPKKFFIIRQKLSSFDKAKETLNLELFCQARYLLAALADQCEPSNEGPSKGTRELSFFIETNAGIAKYNFKPKVSWEALKSITVEQKQIESVKKLRQLINLGDSQDSERRSVLRSAFHELISVYQTDSAIFEGVLTSIEKLYKRYEEHHGLFVQRFSINKVLHEISEKDLSYTSKVNEILSNAQTKALTIPGALILIGAVMKIDQLIDGLAVGIAILITTVLVHKGLNVHENTLHHIRAQVCKDFGQYDVLSEKIEVRQKAKEAQDEISILLSKAENNSSFMKGAIWFLCIIALIFITFTIIDVAKSESHESAPQKQDVINTIGKDANETQSR